MIWIATHPRFSSDMLGFIPGFFSDDDPRPAREQIAERYQSGWHPINGCTMDERLQLCYPGDPPFIALAFGILRNETLVLYQHDFLAIIQRDGTFEVARVD